MKDKFNQFVDNLNGQFVEVSYKKALYQCMDLVYNWAFCLGFPKATIQHLYAYQAYTNPIDLTKEYFDLIPNTPNAIPQDGDIVVWNKTSSNIAGHIAIALSGGTTNSFMCFEQNNPLGTNAHIQSWRYTNVLGWLRPKKVESSQEVLDKVRRERDENWDLYQGALKEVEKHKEIGEDWRRKYEKEKAERESYDKFIQRLSEKLGSECPAKMQDIEGHVQALIEKEDGETTIKKEFKAYQNNVSAFFKELGTILTALPQQKPLKEALMALVALKIKEKKELEALRIENLAQKATIEVYKTKKEITIITLLQMRLEKTLEWLQIRLEKIFGIFEKGGEK